MMALDLGKTSTGAWKGLRLVLWLWMPWCWLVGILPAQLPTGTIRYLDRPPQIDGQLDDWAADSVIEYRQDNPVAEASNSLRVQLGWDDQYLYLCAQVIDGDVVQLTRDPARIYLNDAVELYIDPLDDSRKRMDINDYQFIVDHRGAVAVLKGEKNLIMDSSNTAPKELGIATVAFQHAVQVQSAQSEGEGGFSVEIAVPFAAIGLLPQAGSRLKIDVCVDDVDSLVNLDSIPENGHLPGFFASNWDGYRDFSFPDHWRTFVLVGGPSVTSQISKDLLPYWIWIVLVLVVVGAVVIGWQGYRIRQLKDVLPRTDVKAGVVEQLRMPIEPMRSLAEPQSEVRNGTESVQEVPNAQSDAEGPSLESIPTTQPAKAALHPQIERCRNFVLAHLDEDLKMEDLASECALSLRTLQRIFKEEMDMSPGNFVVLIKMERALELLRSGQCNVSEAAWQLGFQDSSYFSRVFKKYHGISPSRIL